MLEVSDISFDYADKPLLHHINLTLAAGTFLHVQGVNGSGKTTLLKLIAGLLQPEKGRIYYQGQYIWHNIMLYQQRISYLGHKSAVSLRLTLAEHCYLELCLDNHSDNLKRIISLFSLEKYWLTPLYLLSAGLLRKVGLLRTLLAQTNLWLLDEPLVALDSCAMDALLSEMRRHLQQGGQIIASSHQPVNLTGIAVIKYDLSA